MPAKCGIQKEAAKTRYGNKKGGREDIGGSLTACVIFVLLNEGLGEHNVYRMYRN